jgi:cytochrome c oxidase cbb3-type subunit 3
VSAHEPPEWPAPEDVERDGIGEEDNAIPTWWWGGFLVTVLFAAVYIPTDAITGWTQERQYAEQVREAEQRLAAVRAALPSENPFRGDATARVEGEQVFATICAACHKPDGSGLVGPSLVDPYWKYGSSDADLFASVAKGRPGGMPAWEAQLGTDKIWKALAYMESLERSREPGVGAPGFAPPGSAPSATAAVPAPGS